MEDITYALTEYSQDPKLNATLLEKKLEKFGTIYNTVKRASGNSGTINIEIPL